RDDVHLVPSALSEPPLLSLSRRAARRDGRVATRGRSLRATTPPPSPSRAKGRGGWDRDPDHACAGRARAVRAALRAHNVREGRDRLLLLPRGVLAGARQSPPAYPLRSAPEGRTGR